MAFQKYTRESKRDRPRARDRSTEASLRRKLQIKHAFWCRGRSPRGVYAGAALSLPMVSMGFERDQLFTTLTCLLAMRARGRRHTHAGAHAPSCRAAHEHTSVNLRGRLTARAVPPPSASCSARDLPACGGPGNNTKTRDCAHKRRRAADRLPLARALKGAEGGRHSQEPSTRARGTAPPLLPPRACCIRSALFLDG